MSVAYARVVTIDAEELRQMIRAELEAALRQRPVPALAVAPRHATYLKVPAAAARFGVSPDTIREWIHDGRLPRRKDGRHFLVSPEEIEQVVMQLGAGAQGEKVIDVAAQANAILARIR